MQILLGCGHDRTKKLCRTGRNEWQNLVRVDMNPAVEPDIVHDLTSLPLPFDDESAEEIHLYDVLEHTRQQGDWRGFFAEFTEFFRILKPGGHLFGICPRWDGVWAWADPGHTRVISPDTLGFLSQAKYAAECRPGGTNRTDYRFCWRGDFEIVWARILTEAQWGFVLRANKPGG
jgi:SAM-dependent methyltransferase